MAFPYRICVLAVFLFAFIAFDLALKLFATLSSLINWCSLSPIAAQCQKPIDPYVQMIPNVLINLGSQATPMPKEHAPQEVDSNTKCKEMQIVVKCNRRWRPNIQSCNKFYQVSNKIDITQHRPSNFEAKQLKANRVYLSSKWAFNVLEGIGSEWEWVDHDGVVIFSITHNWWEDLKPKYRIMAITSNYRRLLAA